MRTESATPSPCPTPARPARREFLAGLAGVTAAAGVVVAAVASPDPDAELLALVADLRQASADVERLAALWSEAEERASARYPALPSWSVWADANHPAGPFMQVGNPHSAGRAALVELLRQLPATADGQIDVGRVDWDGPHGEAIVDGMVKAQAQYFAEIRPAYDAVVAEQEAIKAAIDEAEGVDAADAAVAAAERLQGEAVAALLACRPKTASGFIRKTEALLPHLGSGIRGIGATPAALLADAEVLIAEGVA